MQIPILRNVPAFAAVAAVALLAGCSPGADFHVARGDAVEAVLISDVAVLHVGRGVRLPGRDVLLRDGRIAAIGLAGQLAAPDGACWLFALGRLRRSWSRAWFSMTVARRFANWP